MFHVFGLERITRFYVVVNLINLLFLAGVLSS